MISKPASACLPVAGQNKLRYRKGSLPCAVKENVFFLTDNFGGREKMLNCSYLLRLKAKQVPLDKQVCAQLCLEMLIIDVMRPKCKVPKANVLAIRAIKHQVLKVALACFFSGARDSFYWHGWDQEAENRDTFNFQCRSEKHQMTQQKWVEWEAKLTQKHIVSKCFI